MMQQRWDADLYDQKLGFVAQYGKDVLQWLAPAAGERILDIGCGTGDLTEEIHQYGAQVNGMDLDEEMIQEARRKYPHIRFDVANAEQFTVEEPYDGVFSNAALHWMTQPAAVLQCVWQALKPGGRFVGEFGGSGNVAVIIQAIQSVMLERYAVDTRPRNPWYFPTIGEYSSLLEAQGFRVVQAAHFDRPTVLSDEERGLRHWLTGFAGSLLRGLTEEELADVYEQIEAKTRHLLYDDGIWHADYVRIRISAVKPHT